MNPRDTKQSECQACGATIVPRFGIVSMLVSVLVILPILDVLIELFLNWLLPQYFPAMADSARLLTFSLLALLVVCVLLLIPWYKTREE